jgi:hypothetical protein
MGFDCMSYKDAGAKQTDDYRDRFNHLMDYSLCWERAPDSLPLLHVGFVGPTKRFHSFPGIGGGAGPRSNGPRPEVRLTRPDVRLKAIDSGQPFPGNVAAISDRSLFLLAPRTCERARQVPLSLTSDTSRKTRVSALKTVRAARQLRRRTNPPEME